jgi:aldehyde:ferredoxin oxidoreductase
VGPEYEALACLGSQCLVSDLKAISKANDLCNRYGIDVISTGCVISFVMEAYEKGIISKKGLDNIDLKWGNAQAVIEIIKRIGERKGIGDLLSEGVKKIAQKIGKNSEEFSVEVKGMECPAHDPRAIYSVAVAYATRCRGGCHTMMTQVFDGFGNPLPDLGYTYAPDRFEVEGKGIFTARVQNYITMFNVLGICRFLINGKIYSSNILEWLEHVTGWKMNLQEFLQVGERCINLKRMYNVRCGISRKDDTLPKRFLTLKRGTGEAANSLPPLGRMLSEYYLYREWSEEGIPCAKKLKQLGLEKEISDLPSHLQVIS